MEIIIIVLIAVEAALAIIREYHDVAELVRGLFSSPEDKELEALGSEVVEKEHGLLGNVVESAGVGRDETAHGTHWTDFKRLV